MIDELFFDTYREVYKRLALKSVPAIFGQICGWKIFLTEKSIKVLHYYALSAPFKPVPAIFGPCSLPYIWTHHPAPGFKTKCFEGVKIPEKQVLEEDAT